MRGTKELDVGFERLAAGHTKKRIRKSPARAIY